MSNSIVKYDKGGKAQRYPKIHVDALFKEDASGKRVVAAELIDDWADFNYSILEQVAGAYMLTSTESIAVEEYGHVRINGVEYNLPMFDVLGSIMYGNPVIVGAENNGLPLIGIAYIAPNNISIIGMGNIPTLEIIKKQYDVSIPSRCINFERETPPAKQIKLNLIRDNGLGTDELGYYGYSTTDISLIASDFLIGGESVHLTKSEYYGMPFAGNPGLTGIAEDAPDLIGVNADEDFFIFADYDCVEIVSRYELNDDQLNNFYVLEEQPSTIIPVIPKQAIKDLYDNIVDCTSISLDINNDNIITEDYTNFKQKLLTVFGCAVTSYTTTKALLKFAEWSNFKFLVKATNYTGGVVAKYLMLTTTPSINITTKKLVFDLYLGSTLSYSLTVDLID